MNRPFSWQELEWIRLIRHLMTLLSERLGTIFRLLIRFYRRRKEPFKNSCQQRTPFIYYFPFIDTWVISKELFSSFKVIDSLSFLPALKSMPQAAVSRNAKIPIRITYGTDTGWSLLFRMNLSKLKMHSTISKMVASRWEIKDYGGSFGPIFISWEEREKNFFHFLLSFLFVKFEKIFRFKTEFLKK